MEQVVFTFAVITIVAVAFAIWLNTKSGEKWLEHL